VIEQADRDSETRRQRKPDRIPGESEYQNPEGRPKGRAHGQRHGHTPLVLLGVFAVVSIVHVPSLWMIEGDRIRRQSSDSGPRTGHRRKGRAAVMTPKRPVGPPSRTGSAFVIRFALCQANQKYFQCGCGVVDLVPTLQFGMGEPPRGVADHSLFVQRVVDDDLPGADRVEDELLERQVVGIAGGL
jgi:hypothetical protein